MPRFESWFRARSLKLVGLIALALAGCQCGVDKRYAGSDESLKTDQPPLPTNSLIALWGLNAKDVWAVGDEGAIQHFDGKIWSVVPSPTKKSLLGIGGTAPDDIWAVGEEGTTVHYDGKTWTASADKLEEGVTYLGVWAAAKSEVWVSGVDHSIGLLRHFIGDKWEEVPISAATSLWEVWGFGMKDVWMVGSDSKSAGQTGFVLRGDAKNFDRFPFEGASLRAIGGSSSDDVWIGAYTGELYHWNGKEWSATPPVAPETHLLSLWAAGAKDIWAVGFDGLILHFDGKSWTRSESNTKAILWSVWGSSPKDVWVVGNDGTRLHWNGSAWK